MAKDKVKESKSSKIVWCSLTHLALAVMPDDEWITPIQVAMRLGFSDDRNVRPCIETLVDMYLAWSTRTNSGDISYMRLPTGTDMIADMAQRHQQESAPTATAENGVDSDGPATPSTVEQVAE